MKNFKRRWIAGAMVLFLGFSSTGTAAVSAAEEDTVLALTESIQETLEHSLNGSEENDQTGQEKILTITDEYADETGTITIRSEEWDKIVVSGEVTAEHLILDGVTAQELIVKSNCALTVKNCTIDWNQYKSLRQSL